MFYRIILILVFLPSLVKSQNLTLERFQEKAESFTRTNMDSSIYYWTLLKNAALQQDDQQKLEEAYAALGSIYKFKGDSEKVKLYAEKCLAITQASTKKWSAYNQIGSYYFKENLAKADSIHQLALNIALEDQINQNISTSYGNLARVKTSQGDLYGSLSYFLKALEYTENDLSKAMMNNSIAGIFVQLKNYERANEYIQKAIEISEANQFNARNGYIALSHGKILLGLKQYDLVPKEIERALGYFSKRNNTVSLCVTHNLQTNLAIAQGDWEAAKRANDKVLEELDQLPSKIYCQSLINTAQILLREGKFSETVKVASQVLEKAKVANFAYENKTAHSLASKAYEGLNQTDISFDHYKIFDRLNDSLYQSDQIALLNYLESEYNRQGQENTIALLDTQNELQATTLRQQRTLMIIGGISLLIILGLVFYLSRFNHKIKTQNQIISRALEEKDTLLREIHHRVKNNLQLVSSLLGLQSRYVSDPQALEALNSGKSRVRSMALIHQDLYNKENLTGVSVKTYLEKLCNELIGTYQIDTQKITLDTQIDDIDLDVETLIPLGLIINELLTNALKYAFPTGEKGKITVKLFEAEGNLNLEVSDNGIGMSKPNTSKNSFGYKLIDTLLQGLEGELKHEVENGTRIFLSFNQYKLAA